MLELSLSPKERLMHLLKYSRPTGMNKRIRSYVVSRKIGVVSFTRRLPLSFLWSLELFRVMVQPKTKRCDIERRKRSKFWKRRGC
ncbi:unnamed protein product [Nippostrongylus brasiliensis]|uniref:Uncharacterized protein n=1 Tax=Nippostrongylus brasiliensis TaxID=27835 RepID=A0A0N4YPP9_NIPBR|nr:unnamed protein product [Nippostrongylus brasiliensis]